MDKEVCRLLIADDEYWVCENLKNMVDWDSLSIRLLEPAADGEEALRRVREEEPDILITDINMPFIRGTELIRQARQICPKLQAVVLSGYSDFAFVRESMVNGALDYLLKPVTKNALFAVLNRALSILDDNRAQELAERTNRRKLLIASSVLQDAEMSRLISEETSREERNAYLLELELQFAAFTLMVVRLSDIHAALKRFGNDMPALSFEIKNIITRIAEKSVSVVFHNNFVRSEFVLITDTGHMELDALYRRLEEAVGAAAGTAVELSVSPPYYSFEKLHLAYHEAHTAFLARPVGQRNPVARFDDLESRPVAKRVSAGHERQLALAVQTRNRALAKHVIFSEIGLADCEAAGWTFLEVRQAVKQIAGILLPSGNSDTAQRTLFTLDALYDQLDIAVASQSIQEVCSVLEQMVDEGCGQSAAALGETIRDTVHRVRAYIDENYFEDISLASLAKLFLVDRSYLSKAFKQITGSNVTLYISTLRMKKAAEYISQGALSLTEIASLAGFDEYAYFNRVFRKIMGKSPSDYKAELQKAPKRGPAAEGKGVAEDGSHT